MNIGIISKNDIPVYLLKAFRKTQHLPMFIAIQNHIDPVVRNELEALGCNENLFSFNNEQELLDKIDPPKLDLVINCACNIQFDELLEQNFDFINIHFSLLPRMRGRHPLQWSLIRGLKQTGFSIHRISKNIDAGPILWQHEVEITEGMSVKELRTRIIENLVEDLPSFITSYVQGDIQAQKNDSNQATYVARRYPGDSQLIEWEDRDLIYRKIRALRSEDYPAYLHINNHKITCLDAEKSDRFYEGIHQPFVALTKGRRFMVTCNDGRTLWITADNKSSEKISRNDKIHFSRA